MTLFRIFGCLLLFCFSALSLNAEKFTFTIGQFEKIRVTTNINVIYHCQSDTTGMAWYEAEAGMNDIFNLDIKKDGTLKVQLTDAYWGKQDLPTLHLYSDFLSSVENSSDLTIVIDNLIPCAAFSANQIGNGSIIVEGLKCNNVSAAVTTGNGSVNLSGKCVNASFRMVGAGLISADRLQAENVKCSILGTGSIGCWAVDNLSVKGLGTTKIYYKGNPNIKKSGGGKIFELPEEYADDFLDPESDLNNTPIDNIKPTNPVPTNNEAENDEIDDDEDEDDDDWDEQPLENEGEEEEEYQTVVTAEDYI